MAWNAGYVTDVNYTFGYYPELNPARAAFALAMAAVEAPKIRNACELGFGQGLSTVIHAAAQSGTRWWGTDFNPAQALFAQNLVSKSGSEARLYDQSFEEFCTRDDLPAFEFIALHGVWTWVSDKNRDVIVDFLRRKLAVGGVVYISYNAQPGWSVAAPLRHMIKEHYRAMGAPSVPMGQRLDDAIAYLDKVVELNGVFSRQNPSINERVDLLKGRNHAYLAHEYLNADWRPMYFTEVVELLADTKMTYVTPAHLLEQDSLNLSPAQMELMAAISDPLLKETTRDFLTAQQFRRDLWVKGVNKLPPMPQTELLRQKRFLLIVERGDVSLTLTTLQGEAKLVEAIYKPLLDALADHKVKTFAELEAIGRAAGAHLGMVANAISVLVGLNVVASVQHDETIEASRGACGKLNAALVSLSRTHNEIGHLASPVTGGGIPLGRFEQLFLGAYGQGLKTPAEWAHLVYQLLLAQGQQINREGRTLETAEEHLTELTAEAEQFQRRLPILQALGIA